MAGSASGAQCAGSGTGPQVGAAAPADRGAAVRQVRAPRVGQWTAGRADRLQLQGLPRCQHPRRARRAAARTASSRAGWPMPDAIDLLKAELHDEAEAEALRIEASTLLAELDDHRRRSAPRGC